MSDEKINDICSKLVDDCSRDLNKYFYNILRENKLTDNDFANVVINCMSNLSVTIILSLIYSYPSDDENEINRVRNSIIGSFFDNLKNCFDVNLNPKQSGKVN